MTKNHGTVAEEMDVAKMPANRARKSGKTKSCLCIFDFFCTNKHVFSTVHGILGEESDCKSVELEASGSEIDPLLAELDKIHQMELHVRDVNKAFMKNNYTEL